MQSMSKVFTQLQSAILAITTHYTFVVTAKMGH
jgi:hypothetical protein